MKKSIIIIVFIILIGGIFAFKNILLNNKVDVPSESINDVGNKSEMLSMMFEQTYGSGDYVVTTQNNSPTYDYVFNATLSNCENGTKLSWNDETDQVLISGYITDKCHIYFDKVDPSLPTPTALKLVLMIIIILYLMVLLLVMVMFHIIIVLIILVLLKEVT